MAEPDTAKICGAGLICTPAINTLDFTEGEQKPTGICEVLSKDNSKGKKGDTCPFGGNPAVKETCREGLACGLKNGKTDCADSDNPAGPCAGVCKVKDGLELGAQCEVGDDPIKYCAEGLECMQDVEGGQTLCQIKTGGLGAECVVGADELQCTAGLVCEENVCQAQEGEITRRGLSSVQFSG
jgi:hypothetical protein